MFFRIFLLQFILLILISSQLVGCTKGMRAKSFKSIASFENLEADLARGKALYNSNCIECHGVLEVSMKRGKSSREISWAILNVPRMAHLSFLNDADMQSISMALNEEFSNDPKQAEGISCDTRLDVGQVAMHKLNQVEYRNTIHSLTGVRLVVDPEFPSEEVDEFANNAMSLKLTEAQMRWYLKTAIEVIDKVFADQSLKSGLISCDAGSRNCRRSAVNLFADRAWRRPLEGNEKESLFGLMDQTFNETQGNAEEVLKTALQAVLIHPNFLYRNVELQQPFNPGATESLDAYELAERISFFLWGDIPDETLIKKVLAGVVSDKVALRQEVLRLLKSPKSGRHLGEGFFSYWLGLHEFSSRTPNVEKFPEFRSSIRSAMKTESQLFFENLVVGNRPITEVLTSEETYLNEELADFYGISGVVGSGFRKVSLSDSNRTGALTHGSLLTTTSHSSGTSIVRRGGFVAFQLQCLEVGSPPEGVTELAPPDGRTSVRDRLEAHRSNPVCASCHKVMDPPGFGLEGFDAIGRSRTTDDEGFPLDTSGELVDGERFQNARELAQILAEDRKFHRCSVRKLMTFALGRQLKSEDQCIVDKITSAVGTGTLADIIVEIISSDVFTTERGG